MSVIINIADAVTAELNAAPEGTFSRAFTAAREVLPDYELKELAELKVTVVPKASEISGATRSVHQYDFSVDIGIQQKIATDLDAEVAELLTLVEQIADYLRKRPLSSALGIAWVSAENDPIYVPQHLDQQRVFTSVLTLNYRGMR